VEIVGYEVIITKPVDVPPAGFSKPVLSARVALHHEPHRSTEFFAPATEYEFEVLALSARQPDDLRKPVRDAVGLTS
jgi:hypothetical protein